MSSNTLGQQTRNLMEETKMIMRIAGILIICLVLWPCLGSTAGTLISQPNSEELLDSVQIVVYNQEKSVDWLKVVDSIVKLGDLGIPEAKPLLVDILRREAPLQLVAGVPLPGIMPPLEMLKAAAIDSLVKLGDKESLPEIEKIGQTTSFQALREKARRALLSLQEQ